MSIIYIVTEGSYSDMKNVGAYSTRKKAEEAQALIPNDSNIEALHLDSLPVIPEGLKGWYVSIVDSTIKCSVPISPFTCTVPEEDFITNGQGILVADIFTWARDEEHAKKIALDKYYQHKAQLAGL